MLRMLLRLHELHELLCNLASFGIAYNHPNLRV